MIFKQTSFSSAVRDRDQHQAGQKLLRTAKLHLTDPVLFHVTVLIVPVAVPCRIVPELHTVLVPPVVAVGLVLTPETAGGRKTMEVKCAQTFKVVKLERNKTKKKRFSRLVHWGPVYPFPLSLHSFVRQPDPGLFVTCIEAIDEGL